MRRRELLELGDPGKVRQKETSVNDLVCIASTGEKFAIGQQRQFSDERESRRGNTRAIETSKTTRLMIRGARKDARTTESAATLSRDYRGP